MIHDIHDTAPSTTSRASEMMAEAVVTKTILAVALLGFAIYAGTDPFHLSPIARFPNFKPYAVDSPPWSQLPLPKDDQNRLQKSEIKFLNEVQGPESIAFDPEGRGPYTGVADGRIMFWNGHQWLDFAFTSPNRLVGTKHHRNFW